MPEIIAYRMVNSFEIFIKSNNILVIRCITNSFTSTQMDEAIRATETMGKHLLPLGFVIDLRTLINLPGKLNDLTYFFSKHIFSLNTAILIKENLRPSTLFAKEMDLSSINFFTDPISAEKWAHLRLTTTFKKNQNQE